MTKAKQYSSFVHIAHDRAKSNANQKCFTYLSDGESTESILSFGDLYSKAEIIGRAISNIASPGDRVLLICMPGLDYILREPLKNP